MHIGCIANHLIENCSLGRVVLQVTCNLHPFSCHSHYRGSVEGHRSLLNHIVSKITNPLELKLLRKMGCGVDFDERRPNVGDIDTQITVVEKIGIARDLEAERLVPCNRQIGIGDIHWRELEMLHRKVCVALIHLRKIRHRRISVQKYILGAEASELDEAAWHAVLYYVIRYE